MPEQPQSANEIERALEDERIAFRETIDQISNRLTFDDMWDRAGSYMRDHGSDIGSGFARIAREKPVAVALTAVGIAMLAFGPAERSPRPRRPRRWDRNYDPFPPLEEADFADRRARGPVGQRARTDPWSAPARGPRVRRGGMQEGPRPSYGARSPRSDPPSMPASDAPVGSVGGTGAHYSAAAGSATAAPPARPASSAPTHAEGTSTTASKSTAHSTSPEGSPEHKKESDPAALADASADEKKPSPSSSAGGAGAAASPASASKTPAQGDETKKTL